MRPDVEEIVGRLEALANSKNVAGMARYGINRKGTLGIPLPTLRKLAREAGRDHQLALRLWDTGIHEARILAAMVDDPSLVSEAQAERWVADLDSWDVCDGLCNNLLRRTRFAHAKALEWCGREAEFVRRAGFVMIAVLAVHDRAAPDSRFLRYLPLIDVAALDDRNFVKKAVNWALRQIGKRNSSLNVAACALAGELAQSASRPASGIGRDALRELTSKAVQRRLARHSKDGEKLGSKR
jgi:3-methyladenine DNA glycosylase AlkD